MPQAATASTAESTARRHVPTKVPATTSAAILTAHGEPLSLAELPLPERLEAGSALVRVSCATLCGTDVELWTGKMTFPGMLPIVLGHEMIGDVVAVGDDTRDALGRPIEPGSRIGWSESSCGECHGCAVLREPVACSTRGYGFTQRADAPPYATGGLSEYVYVVPRAAKLLLPAEVPDHLAAMAGCAAKTVLRALDRAGGVRTGDRVVVQGAGALGLFATAAARVSGAAQVVTVGAPEPRLALARAFGADETIAIDSSEEIVDQVRDVTNGHGADLVIDLAGAPSVGREAVDMAAQRGRLAVVGSTGPEECPVPLGTVMGKELTIVGSLNGDISDYQHAIEFFRVFGPQMPWDHLFSAPVPLSEASRVIAEMNRLEQVKAVIDPRL